MLPIDLTGKQFGKLSILRLLKRRGKLGERIWLCRCECGNQTKVRSSLLLRGRTKSCGCLRTTTPAERIKDLAGKRFGFLEVLGIAEKRTSEGRILWRCRCVHRTRDGSECGREVLAPGRQLQSGWRSSCGHHRKGFFRKTFWKRHKIKSRIRLDGERWVLPKRAARMLRISRVREDRIEGIRRRVVEHPFAGPLTYLSEKDVQGKVDERSQLKAKPKVAGHLILEASAEKLKRSAVRVREVAREVFEEKLPRFDSKDGRGRACKKTFVPVALHKKLRTYFAEAPAKQLEGLRSSKEAKRGAEPPPESAKPRWDGEARILWLGDLKLKVFGFHPATNQIELIEAFACEGWPPRVADPFNDKEKLKEAYKELNRAMPEASIHFGGDGTGKGVCWRKF